MLTSGQGAKRRADTLTCRLAHSGFEGGVNAFELRFERVQQPGGLRQVAGDAELLETGTDLDHTGGSHVAGAALEQVARLFSLPSRPPLDGPPQGLDPGRHVVDEQ